jgi:hypothetical protein
MKTKSVPFRLKEDAHAEFKGYCGAKRTTMQAFLEKMVLLVNEADVDPEEVFDAISRIKTTGSKEENQ